MHKYLRAIGFSNLTDKKELEDLLTDIALNGTERSFLTRGEKPMIAEFGKKFAEGIGITVCGELDDDNRFTYEYYYPYLRGNIISSEEDVSVERHTAQESYAGVCDDIKVGVSLIFFLQNKIPYVKASDSGNLPIRGTTLILSALSVQGTIMMPIMKTEKDLIKNKRTAITRTQLIDAARKGDEEAIENLTLEDMDTYTTISRRIQKEDVFSLVDTYFMPYGIECDHYSILAEIIDCNLVKNKMTDEEIYLMTLNCNDLIFDLCINKKDLYGEPASGRRFKGIIWMQGFINFPRH